MPLLRRLDNARFTSKKLAVERRKLLRDRLCWEELMDLSSDSKSGLAFGSPGIPPRWTSSQKDGVGTAYSASSRVWFTISHGILNEIYYPTIDRPQVRDLQFLITDGQTFFHEEKRDLDNTVECI
jgi:hypothetical protein